MGLSLLAALIVILLAYVAMSPRLQRNLGLGGSRIGTRAREFVGYAIAFMLLTVGFFLAGVPVNSQTAVSGTPMVVEATVLVTVMAESADVAAVQPTPTLTPVVGSGGSDSGAFGGPPPGSQDDAAATEPSDELTEATPEDEVEATDTADTVPTATPTAVEVAETSPTPTPTPRPTQTATPTATSTPPPTPTPVMLGEETAVIDTGGNTLWLRRTPGGRTLILLQNGEIILLSAGRASFNGELWREVRTIDGTLGWVQAAFVLEE